MVKNPPANAGDMGSFPGPGRSHRSWRNWAWVPGYRACALEPGPCSFWAHGPSARSSARDATAGGSPGAAARAASAHQDQSAAHAAGKVHHNQKIRSIEKNFKNMSRIHSKIISAREKPGRDKQQVSMLRWQKSCWNYLTEADLKNAHKHFWNTQKTCVVGNFHNPGHTYQRREKKKKNTQIFHEG